MPDQVSAPGNKDKNIASPNLKNQTSSLEERSLQRNFFVNSATNLRDACWRKRMALWGRANQHQRWQRRLYFFSGLITLLSGGSATALLTTASGAQTFKIIASVIALISGGVSLIATIYFDARETHKMFEGAAKYGSLRDKITTLLDIVPLLDILKSISFQKISDKLGKLREEYSELSSHYDNLIPTSMLASWPQETLPLAKENLVVEESGAEIPHFHQNAA